MIDALRIVTHLEGRQHFEELTEDSGATVAKGLGEREGGVREGGGAVHQCRQRQGVHVLVAHTAVCGAKICGAENRRAQLRGKTERASTSFAKWVVLLGISGRLPSQVRIARRWGM